MTISPLPIIVRIVTKGHWPRTGCNSAIKRIASAPRAWWGRAGRWRQGLLALLLLARPGRPQASVLLNLNPHLASLQRETTDALAELDQSTGSLAYPRLCLFLLLRPCILSPTNR